MIGESFGPYQVLGKLGEGGMGEVYRARDTRLKREVALKILPESFAADGERHARFQREAEVLASLNHPKIAAARCRSCLAMPTSAAFTMSLPTASGSSS